jgi:hypothetical protein
MRLYLKMTILGMGGKHLMRSERKTERAEQARPKERTELPESRTGEEIWRTNPKKMDKAAKTPDKRKRKWPENAGSGTAPRAQQMKQTQPPRARRKRNWFRGRLSTGVGTHEQTSSTQMAK